MYQPIIFKNVKAVILKKLNPKMANGLEQITARILKELTPKGIQILEIIIKAIT